MRVDTDVLIKRRLAGCDTLITAIQSLRPPQSVKGLITSAQPRDKSAGLRVTNDGHV